MQCSAVLGKAAHPKPMVIYSYHNFRLLCWLQLMPASRGMRPSHTCGAEPGDDNHGGQCNAGCITTAHRHSVLLVYYYQPTVGGIFMLCIVMNVAQGSTGYAVCQSQDCCCVSICMAERISNAILPTDLLLQLPVQHIVSGQAADLWFTITIWLPLPVVE